MALQVALVECLSIRDSRLLIEECDVHALAQSFGTPAYVMSENHLPRLR